LWGEHDSLVPRAHADTYSDRFPNSRLEVLPNCGNSLIVESPERTAELISSFIAN
jgi:pimeloyl-ACP methyl ester carboxylesterase